MQKILIIRFSSIGDIVLTTPVVRCLKMQCPEVVIHYITKKAFASILEANPYVDKVFTIDKTSEPLKKVATRLQEEQYDCVIDLHKNWRSFYLRYRLGVKSFVFDKINWQKWLLTQFKIDKMPKVHIVDRYMKTVEQLGVKNDGQGLDYAIPSKDYIQAKALDKRLDTQTYIVFVIGAAHATKRLPAEKIKAICANMSDELIVLIGGKGDVEASKIVEEAGAHIINSCGQLNLHQSAAIVDQARLVIAHDTGFMHIAAALKKEIVSVWGNTVPKFGMYPYLPVTAPPFHVVENTILACRPCSKIGHKKCPKGHFRCMYDIDDKQIIDLVNRESF